jgi:hypothetical protein
MLCHAALNSLAFLLLHSFSMVVAFEGLQTKNRFLTGLVPTLHLTAALLVCPRTCSPANPSLHA